MNDQITILMLGPDSVGKRTILQHVTPALHEESLGIVTRWHNKNIQFLIPNKPLDQSGCHTLFQLLKKKSAIQPLQSLLIIMDIPTLVDETALTNSISQLAEALHFIHLHQKKIDINLMITKCDQVLGFKEYFANLSLEERKKILGTHPTKDFTFLLKQLNAQVITRLHQETLTERRRIIQLFPLQFEKAIDYIQQFIKKLTNEYPAELHAIYFTSSKQKEKSMDLLGQHEPPLPPIITDKPYFIEQAVTQLIEEAQINKLTAKRFDKKRWILLPICLIIAIAFITTWHFSYKNTAQVLEKIELQLERQPHSTLTPPWLAHLNLLQQSIQDLDDPSLKYSRLIGFGQTHALKKKLVLLYQTQLHTQFLPFIEGILSGTLLSNLHGDPLQLYNALKIYLMLTEPHHYDQNTIINWFTLYWQSHYKNNIAAQQILLQQLRQLLTLQNKNWPRNQPLIDNAQKILQQLPASNIIFLELQGTYKNKTQSLADMLEHSDNLDLSQAAIPSLFSPNYFKKIYNEQIPVLVSRFNQGNWVIGETGVLAHDPQQQQQLISDVRVLYLKNFSQSWQDVIPKINLKKPTDFDDIENLINEMTDPKSSLMELLEFVCLNANSNKQLKSNSTLQQVTQFLQQKGPYIKSKNILHTLSTYLTTATHSNDVNKSSYNMALDILNTAHKKSPIDMVQKLNLSMPIQNWLNTIAQGSWAVLLSHSRDYLNQTWSRLVLPDYLNKVSNRYPFNSHSSDATSLTDFTNFLGPDGTIDVFFNYYLKPFVNMSSNYWTWQNVYGQSLPMPQSVLDMFMRASIIQQMFFTDNHQKISFKFSLIPFAQSSNIKSVTLNIEGQISHFTSALHPSSLIVWPGPQPEHALIRVTFKNGHPPITQIFKGPWALFQLVQSAALTTQNTPQKFVLQFQFGDEWVSYHLIANHRINPFIPAVLDKFDCPDIL